MARISPLAWLFWSVMPGSFGLLAQYSTSSPDNSTFSGSSLASGEADPRMELLRLDIPGYDIKAVAGMSRNMALLALGVYYQHEDESIPYVPTVAELKELAEIVEEGVKLETLINIIEPGIEIDLLSEAAQLANLILTNTTVTSSPLDEDRVFTRGRLLANRFSPEVVKLVATHSGNDLIAENIINVLNTGQLNPANQYLGELAESIQGPNNSTLLNARQFRDRKNRETVGNLFGLTTDDFTAFAGKNVEIKAGSTVDVSKWMGRHAKAPDKTKVLAFAAAGDLLIQGDVTFTNGGHEAMDHALALGAAEDLEIADGSTVKYDGANLGLGAVKSIRIFKVSLETSDHLALGTLGHLHINDSTMKAGAGNRVLLYAQNTMEVNGLKFSEGLGQVYMEATTLDLQNVNFPAGSEVRLISEHGGIEGKYPNFSSSVPGRVNFIEAVSYGGSANVMSDRSSFDQFGSRVSIESFSK